MEYQNEIICIYFISYNVGFWVGFLQLYQTDLNQQKSDLIVDRQIFTGSGFVCHIVFGNKKRKKTVLFVPYSLFCVTEFS